MLKVLVPETLAPKEIALVVMDKALPSILIEPPLPVTTEPAVTVVAPKTLSAPTAPLKVVVAEPESIDTVGVVALECVLIVEPNKMSPFDADKEVLRLINPALFYV